MDAKKTVKFSIFALLLLSLYSGDVDFCERFPIYIQRLKNMLTILRLTLVGAVFSAVILMIFTFIASRLFSRPPPRLTFSIFSFDEHFSWPRPTLPFLTGVFGFLIMEALVAVVLDIKQASDFRYLVSFDNVRLDLALLGAAAIAWVIASFAKYARIQK